MNELERSAALHQALGDVDQTIEHYRRCLAFIDRDPEDPDGDSAQWYRKRIEGEVDVKEVQVSDRIVPLVEFESRAGRLLKRVEESGRPMVITQNGRPARVLVSHKEFEARDRFAAATKLSDRLVVDHYGIVYRRTSSAIEILTVFEGHRLLRGGEFPDVE